MTKKEIMETLTAAGIEFNKKASIKELVTLLPTAENAQQSAENAQNTAEQTAQQNSAEQSADSTQQTAQPAEQTEQTGKRTRAERITERNALLEYMHTLASKYSATIGGASDETMKHRAVQRDKHMVIKLVLSDTSIRVCVKQSDRLENVPGLKKVNYNLPYQFVFKDNSEQTRASVAQIFSVAMSQYTDAQTLKALKKAQKTSGKKVTQ